MKNISNELALHIAGEVTTLATCWKLTRRDGVNFAFTDHDLDINVESVIYKAASGFTPSAIQNTDSLNVDNLDIEGVLSSENIEEKDIMAGLYDFAEIEIFMVNYSDLTQGKLKLRRGWLGEVAIRSSQFVVEVRGLTQRLSQKFGELYSASCRASFTDSRCKLDAASFTVSGSVTFVTSNQEFFDSTRLESSGIYNFGKISFTSGDNSGLSMELKEFISGGRIILVLPMPYLVSVGDSYNMTQGCDKTLSTCINRYSNAINFRGEPHVPGIDSMLETAGTRKK
ncbi:MAG: DUF2163 domain-containing protein [Rickettsiales bacterium]